MNKYFVMLLVLAMATLATAGPVWLQVNSSDATVDSKYNAGAVITIDLVASEGIKSISIGAISGEPTALSINGLNTGFDQAPLQPGTLVNSGGTLISAINAGTQYVSPAIAAGEVLWSFEYQVPNVTEPTYFTLDDVTAGAVYTYIGGTDTAYIGDIDALTIQAVPEPMTIALLGLGGLFLRRKK